ncbi:KRAB-A domain-containing protein 2-like [Centruroides sculpturatus]|uniref:KRAB-A domain-containing protein 2-like n=1 Tax=Centruroides sculpturatus TaxID=218467 RepID=UPI000C6E661E|nr:KRAB-A domain-containing protein 2-like [Centruroides sculpturatus]
MVYQDHLTKFVHLLPLKTKTAEEVAYQLLQIFLTFGAPAILHSDNGREFCNKVIFELCTMWKDVKIVHGKPHHSHKAYLKGPFRIYRIYGLHFVQFVKGTAYHEGICQIPYEAMFGVKPKRGRASSSLPGEQIANIETEEQLEEIVNTFEGNLSNGHNKYHIPKENIEDELQPTMSSCQALTNNTNLFL